MRQVLLKGPLKAFNYSQFRIFWLASLLSIVGFFTSIIARGWLALDMTDSAFMVTAVNGIGMLPMLIFSAFGGVIADRMSRKVILISSDLFNLLMLLILSVLVITDTLQLWQLFLLTLFHGVGFAMGTPARAAVVGNILNPTDLPSGVAIFSTIFSLAQLVGPAAAGYLINGFGMGFPFVLSVALLFPAIALLTRLRIQGQEIAGGSQVRVSVLKSIVEGMSYVRSNGLLTGIMLLGFAATVFAMPYQAMLPVFARDILDVGSKGLGVMGGLAGAGAILGSLAVALFTSPRQLRYSMFLGSIGMSTTIVLFSLSTLYPISLILLFLVGLFLQVFMTSNFTVVQIGTPDHIRGRILSLRMIVMGMGPLGMLGLGVLAEAYGASIATAAMGSIALVMSAVIFILIPALRQLDSTIGEPNEALGDRISA